MKNKKILLLSTLLLTSCSSTYTTNIIVNRNNVPFTSSTETKIDNKLLKVNRSVSEDLEKFDIDFSKYYVDNEMVIEPILLQYAESLNSDSMDLYYFYDPNDQFTYSSIAYSVNYSNTDTVIEDIKSGAYSSTTIEYPFNKTLYFTGVSEDGYVKRFSSFVSEEELSNRLSYEYRYYNIKGLNNDEYKIENQYLFNSNNSVSYSNDLTIKLLDPHCWSWHFDEDNGWQNFCDWFTGRDTLKDQLFYSFYVDGWEISDIKSIDLMYKKVLLKGYRYNEADTGNKSRFYKDDTDSKYKPKYYAWNESNSKDNYDTSDYLGSSLEEVTNKVNYTYKTITHAKEKSVGVKHEYEWDLIQNNSSFKSAFGEDSDIYKFANNYFNATNQEYWIINFDDFYYSYSQSQIVVGDDYDLAIMSMGGATSQENRSFVTYLKQNNVPSFTQMPTGAKMVNYYSFVQEYVFNMKATQMTFTDSNETTRTLPVSVTPVSEEASGGTSEEVDDLFEKILKAIKEWFKELFSNIWDVFKWILLAIVGIFGVKFVIKIIKKSKNKEND